MIADKAGGGEGRGSSGYTLLSYNFGVDSCNMEGINDIRKRSPSRVDWIEYELLFKTDSGGGNYSFCARRDQLNVSTP